MNSEPVYTAPTGKKIIEPMSDWFKIIAGLIFIPCVLVFSWWFHNGGQMGFDKCSFAKDPATCRQIGLMAKVSNNQTHDYTVETYWTDENGKKI